MAVILATYLAIDGSYAAVLPMPELPALALLILALLGFVLTGQLYGDGSIEPHAALRCVCLAAVAVIGLQTYMYAVTLLLSVYASMGHGSARRRHRRSIAVTDLWHTA